MFEVEKEHCAQTIISELEDQRAQITSPESNTVVVEAEIHAESTDAQHMVHFEGAQDCSDVGSLITQAPQSNPIHTTINALSTWMSAIQPRESWYLAGWIRDSPIDFLVDPGAVVSAISLQCYEKLVETDAILTPMKAMQIELEAANKSDMRVHGMCNLELSVHGLLINIDAVVVDLNCQAILGMDILGDASKLPFILDLVDGTLSGGGYETIQQQISSHANIQPAILDMIRSDVEKNEQDQPPPPECALTPMIRWDFDYNRDEPPVVQRLAETPRHSTPRPDPNTPSARHRPAIELPRPRASSASPSENPAKRMALRYHPVTEEVTPPITPPRAQAMEENIVPETPSPVQKPGRSRGRGTWRTQQKVAPGVGTHSRTRLAEIEKLEATQAQAAHAQWPPAPDTTENIQRLTSELRNYNVFFHHWKKKTSRQPPAAGLMTQHQDVYYIPPPRVVGGARGNSAPVSTATLGLIQRQDPSLAAQLREDPGSMMTQATRRRVYSTMRLIRTGMLGQLASLQQWEEAMHRQDDA